MSFNREYWEEFLGAMKIKEGFPLAIKKSAGDNNSICWECFGRKGFKLIVSFHQIDNWICVNFGIDRRDQKHHFEALKDKKAQIEKIFGSKLRWDPQGSERSNTQAILTKYGIDVHNRAGWRDQHAWLLNCLEKMYFAFQPNIECLVED